MTYIYPYGGFGKIVSDLLKLANIAHLSLDDNVAGRELASVKFSQSDELLICVASQYDSLYQKAKLAGAKNIKNGISFAARLYDPKAKEHIYKPNLSKESQIALANSYLGRALDSFYARRFKGLWLGVMYSLGGKDTLEIFKILKRANKDVLFICTSFAQLSAMNRELRQSAILVPFVCIGELSFMRNFLSTTSSTPRPKNARVFLLEHAFGVGRILPLLSPNPSEFFANSDYFFSSCKSAFSLESSFAKSSCKIVRAGYPSLDKSVARHKNAKAGEYVLIAARVDDFLYPKFEGGGGDTLASLFARKWLKADFPPAPKREL